LLPWRGVSITSSIEISDWFADLHFVALPELEGFTTEQLDTLDVRVRKELSEKGAEFQSFAVRGRVPAGGLKPKN
jgi:hypothetical protein